MILSFVAPELMIMWAIKQRQGAERIDAFVKDEYPQFCQFTAFLLDYTH